MIKAQSTPLTPQAFFYCPNIVKTDYYGNVRYDAEWSPNDDNFGTTVPYWYALMEPVHGRHNKPEDFKKVNEVLFPNGTDALDIYEWTTDWSDFFDDGHEWYGACCWTVYDKTLGRYIVMLVSASSEIFHVKSLIWIGQALFVATIITGLIYLNTGNRFRK